MNPATTKAQLTILAVLTEKPRAQLRWTNAMAGERAELVMGARRVRVNPATIQALHEKGFIVLYEEIVTSVYVLPTYKEGR